MAEMDEVEESRQRQALLGFGTTKPRRPWTPLQSRNISYEKQLKERAHTSGADRNFIDENIVSL
jgi:hypothetical protein